MEEAPEPSIAETRQWLVDESRGRFGSIPEELIADQILEVTRDADFPVRRAAHEALLRRMKNAVDEGLKVGQAPRGGIGAYVVSRRPPAGSRAARAQERRPYDVLLEAVAPARGECGCPDYLKGSLGLCKHLLVALDYVFQTPRRRDRAIAEQKRALPESAATLHWDPWVPLRGASDRLLGLRYKPNTRAISAGRWTRDGLPHAADLADPRRRMQLLRTTVALTMPSKGKAAKVLAGPGVRALLVVELEIAEREDACLRASRRAALRLANLRRPLYPYQREGVMRFLERGRLLLADDMGLGKTTQAIAACHALYHSKAIERGLVIAPASLKTQWLREWQMTTDVPALVVDGTPDERRAMYRAADVGFLIVNYELLFRDFEDLLPWSRQIVVVDEAQKIKNYATKSAAHVKALPAERRLVLTGTPMENRVEELASLLDWVDDRAMSPKWRLQAWHSVQDSTATRARTGARNLDTLRQRMSTCTLRRARAEVLTQLPKRTDTTIPVALTPAQADAHEELNQPIAQLAQMARNRPLTPPQFLRLMQLLAQQRMIANGLGQVRFDALWPGLEGRPPSRALLDGLFSPKLDEIRTLIEALVCDQGRKVVVFSQWRRMLRLAAWAVSDILARVGHRSMFFTGAESQRLRTQTLVDFHDDPSATVLFLSDAGGVGLNLQRAASACINIELPWNPAVLEQRIGRIYRLGQTRPIEVYNLVSQGSIEQRIAELVGAKSQLFKGLFDGTSDEIRFERASSFMSDVERVVGLPVAGAPSALLRATAEVDSKEDDAVVEREADDSLERTSEGGARERTPGAVPASSNDLASALRGLRVERTSDGGLRIEAPRESAAALSAVFETMSRLLRDAQG